jgi:NTP pyrophosphatase (non-canonical NTP hydrolase)
MDFEQFTKEVLKIKSPVTGLNVPIGSVIDSLKLVNLSGEIVDQFKKQTFLKRLIDVTYFDTICSLIKEKAYDLFRQRGDLGLPTIAVDLKVNIDLVHGILGIITESAELADILVGGLLRGLREKDTAHLKEELGDLLHYIALVLHGCGFELEDVLDTNIAKLSVRYKDGFSFEKANNRDLEAEKQAMERAE